METIWKDIDDFYQVSNSGKVFSIRSNKVLKDYAHKCGYRIISLNKKSRYVHRMVAEAFIPNPNNLPFVNHKDTNKANNNDWNLEWCTAKDNTEHAITNGIINQNGIKNSQAALIEQQVLEIRAKYVYKIYSCGRLAKEYNVTDETIRRIVTGKTWKHL